MSEYVALIPLFPAASALILALLGLRMPRPAISLLACLSVFGSFLITVGYLLMTLGVQLPGFHALPLDGPPLFRFIDSGGMQIDLAFRLDSLSLIMCLVVTGVGFLIHVYSVGYMHHDRDYSRYFTYLNLFTFAMLMLVLGSNLVVLFIGWEGVGLCSYLLIGFWYERKSASDAGKKAFVVNRVGDAGFLAGMMLLYANFGTLNIQPILAQVQEVPQGSLLLNLIALCLFIGATGKSAQIPLYVWLPDAMEGPTPVSALIHAATMVTSGVYMIARMGDLYARTTWVLLVVAWVGAMTAFFAASIGLVQNDIKRVLAYSTVSQLGYMFLACGVAAFDAAIFHLYTHAFFKALLFLGAGSVIHAMSGEQDIRRMGGLGKKLKITTWTFAVATLAITGFPWLSGFYSKDLILEKAFETNVWLWAIGISTAAMTSFYMFRLLNMTFFGVSRVDPAVHPHESPRSMTTPLMLLALGSIAAGWVYSSLPHFISGSIWAHREVEHAAVHGALPKVLAAAAVAVMAIGWLLAYHYYIKEPDTPKRLAERFRRLYKVLLNKYFVDEGYDAAIVDPLKNGSDRVYTAFDLGVIDHTLDSIAAGAMETGRVLARIQTGNLKAYAAAMLVGAVLLLSIWVF
ncbi:MAG: NADH-quinone oxidoreductase subunit L [Acidobacteriota bacterium]